jgi:hypothetical protein
MFISYAQNFEDVMLWRVLRDVEKAFYVDVGAADPEENPVTRAFYEPGRSGINVEPVDEFFDKLTHAGQRNTNLQVAVGQEPELTRHARDWLPVHADSQIATRHQAAGYQVHDSIVPVLTLTKILEPNSTVRTRHKWEHLITGRKYRFA